MDVTRIGVVGAGTMGRGIAQTCAAHGFDVVMSDIGTEAVAAGLDRDRAGSSRGRWRRSAWARRRGMRCWRASRR